MAEHVLHLAIEDFAALAARRIPPSLPLADLPRTPPPDLNGAVRAACGTVTAMLRDDPGFALIRLGRATALDDDLLCSVAWNLFTALCRPVPQYRTGEMMYPVEVSGGGSGASHYSASNATGGFHTDGTILPEPPEIACLLGVSPAEEGGATVLMDGRRLLQHLRALDPRHIDVLGCDQLFDVMGQISGLELKRQRILTVEGDRIEWRYLRYYIESGHARAGEPVPDDLRQAMDAVDEWAADEANQIPVRLERGDLLMWDNQRFLHGRRTFTEGSSRRRLRRMYGMFVESTAPALRSTPQKERP